jgi:hypothetical protein
MCQRHWHLLQQPDSNSEDIVSEWSPGEWAAFLTAFGTFLSVILSAAAAFLANLAKLRSETNTKKIQENTELTKVGVDQLNGKMVENITRSVTDPIVHKLNEHIIQDDKNMHELRDAILELKKCQ